MIPLKYNVRSLFVRKATTFMTMVSIAFVVLIYIGVLALAGGLQVAFAESGDASTVLVLREGARSEMESSYSVETYRILASLPGIERSDDGTLLASGETVTLQIRERRDGSESNVVLRGVEDAAFALRPEIELVTGRRFEPGTGEVIVGSGLADRFVGLELDQEVELGRLQFRVVGIFEAGGSAYSSEIWGAVNDFGDAFRRRSYYSSTRLRAATPSTAQELLERVEADARLRVDPILEPEYYERQTQESTGLFVFLGNLLAGLMAFGACFAAANTMYAQVAVRGREIGTLRALGFRRRQIVAAFLVEAIVLGLLAGVLGALLALPLNAVETGTMNSSTFSEVVFSLRTTPETLAGGVVLATLTGIVGGLLPAWSASRQQITNLLRAA
jgi:putative ABC transport system permease protein